MRRGTALCICMLVLMSMASPAPAFNPQPEPPAMANKLNAAFRDLVEIRIRLNVALAHPPEPGMNGVENRLSATARQLKVLHDRVDAALHPPEPGEPPPDDNRVSDALLNLRDQALGIISDIRNEPPPDDDLNAVLIVVLGNAQAIVDLATDFIVGAKTVIKDRQGW